MSAAQMSPAAAAASLQAAQEIDRKRAAYVAGLRQLAGVLEANPAVPLPYAGSGSEMLIMFFDGDAAANKARLAATVRAFGGHWDKHGDDGSFGLTGTFAGLKVRLCAARDEVCTRVVTGSREVTRMVQDPAALAAVPEIEVTEVVEDVEWQCGPVLDAATRPVTTDALDELAYVVVPGAAGSLA